MDTDAIRRLEVLVDRLLARQQDLEERCRALEAEKTNLLAERERFTSELDRVLAKLEHLEPDQG